MPHARRIALATLSCVTLAVSGCAASTTSGTGSAAAAGTGTASTATATATNGAATSGSDSSGTAAPPPSSTAPAGGDDVSALAARLLSATTGIKTARFTLTVTAGPSGSITGRGAERLADGKATALDVTEGLPGGAGTLRVIIVDGRTYVKLPPQLNTGRKPYTLVTPNSSSAVVRSLASSLASTRSSASIDSFRDFVRAAESLTDKGMTTVGGTPATHYSISVSVAKLPASTAGKQALLSAGLTTIPVELYLDPMSRPVLLVEKLSVQGQQVSTRVAFTDYNRPVTITAPPASQVGR